MSRSLKIAIAILAVLVVVSIFSLPSLRLAIQRTGSSPRTEEQARRDVMQVPISTPTDVKVSAKMYWLSATSPTSLEVTSINLPLSADPVERSKQLLIALISNAPAPERRTLPPDATVLAFYLQPDGTAIADFSDALSVETPSGILSEKLVVDSIAQTLGSNVPAILQLKILIHGQEPESLAGHIDLTGLFPVAPPISEDTPAPPTPAQPGSASPPPAKKGTN